MKTPAGNTPGPRDRGNHYRMGGQTLMHQDGNSRTNPMRDTGNDLLKIYHGIIESLVTAISAKDSYYEPHRTTRLQTICTLVARNMGLDEDTTIGICIASILSDIGKLGVPEHIVLKPGPP